MTKAGRNKNGISSYLNLRDKFLTPVRGYKQGRITREDYAREYYDMMRKSYRHHRQRWDEVLGMKEVVLTCYCRVDSFCHRYLLKDMLVKCGGVYVGEIRSLEDI